MLTVQARDGFGFAAEALRGATALVEPLAQQLEGEGFAEPQVLRLKDVAAAAGADVANDAIGATDDLADARVSGAMFLAHLGFGQVGVLSGWCHCSRSHARACRPSRRF